MRIPKLQTSLSLADEKLCSVSDSTAIHLNGRAELVWNGKEEAVNSTHKLIEIITIDWVPTFAT